MVNEIGGKNLMIQKAWQVIEQTQVERPEKVAALRDIVQQGDYKIDYGKLASIILLEVLTRGDI